jgi:hypothetical protein
MLACQPNRPVLLAESGAVEPRHTGPFKLYAADTNGVILHDVLFAPFFAGAAGPGHIWHWDVYVSKLNLWWHFGRFAEVVKDLDVPAEHFVPEMLPHERLRIYALKGRNLALVWCRDLQNTWQTELAENKPPDGLKGLNINVRALMPTGGGGKIRYYDPWRNRWAAGALERDGTIKLPEFQRSLVVRIN